MLIDPVWHINIDSFVEGSIVEIYHSIHSLEMKFSNPSKGIEKTNWPIWYKWNSFIPGIYWAFSFNYSIDQYSNYEVIHEWDEYNYEKLIKLLREKDSREEEFDRYSTPKYGSADSVEQVINHFRKFINDPDRYYILSVMELDKKNNPDWRWHKNGTYIGIQEPMHEHLGEEPLIDKIIKFEIHQVKIKNGNISKNL